jgi:hypothetical protein
MRRNPLPLCHVESIFQKDMHKMKNGIGFKEERGKETVKNQSHVFTVITLFIILGLMSYVDSPQSMKNKRVDISVSVPASMTTEEEITPVQMPTLEKKLVDTEYVNGYFVETYREFEIYKDENGEVLKSVPTSHFDYIRYKVGYE